MHRRSVLAGAIAATAISRVTVAQAAELRFGALYPFSGPLALLGDESFRGFELAAEERNAAGGIGNARIRFIRGDAVDQNQAIGEVRRLTGVERAQAIFGTYASPLSFAASQVTELAGIPYFELGAISDPITERGFKYLFRTAPVAKYFGEVTVDAVTGIAAKLNVAPKTMRIAILREDGIYGTTVSGAQKARIAQLEYQVVEDLSYSVRAVDLSSVVQRLRGANVDVVLHTGYQNDILLFYRGMKEAGWKPKAVIGSGAGYSLTDTLKAVGTDFQNTMNVDFTQFAVNEAVAPGVKAFVETYTRKYGSAPRSGHSLANFMGARVFFDVIQRAGSMDKDRIRAAVLATDVAEFTTPTGWGAKFDEKGQNLRARPFLLQWQGEQQVTVWPANAAVAELKIGLGAS